MHRDQPSLRQFLDQWTVERPDDVVELEDDTDIDWLTAIALEFERRQRAPVLMITRSRC